MSKKNKPSSTKKSNKNSKKTPQKASKPVKAVSKKNTPKKSAPVKKIKTKAPVKKVKHKASKVSARPQKKVAPKKIAKKPVKNSLKKTVAKIVSPVTKKTLKPVKTVAKKEIKTLTSKTITSAKKQMTFNEKRSSEIIKNPVHLKKDNNPIPEFKPIIQPTVKTESNSNKDSFPASLKSTASSIITPKKTEAYSVRPEKEPAGKFEMEFVIRASAELLYEFLVTPSGLSEWFCDDVNIRNGIYTFIWDGQLQQARLLKTIEEQLVRYQWVDKSDGSYFEFRIQRDELTNDISMIITDFAGDKGEQESAKLLWTSQVDKLLHVMGSFF